MSQKPYTTREAVANYLGITIPSGLNAQVDEWILAMSEYADNIANRVLYQTDSSTFKYDGDGSNLMVIKDCTGITEVKIDGSVMPLDKVSQYPQNKGYTSRIALSDGYRFSKGLLNVSVTAKHGMSATLKEDVKLAVTVLVAGIYNARNSQGKVGTTERIGNYSITYREASQKTDYETAKATLSSYRRVAL